MMPTKDTAYGVVVVHRTDADRFLLLQQTVGHWGFPKGHKEGTETDKEAALRELEEETGIVTVSLFDAPVISEKYSFTMNDITYNKTVWYYTGFVVDTAVTIQESEILQYRWATYEEAMSILTYKETKETLQKAREYLQVLPDRQDL